MNTIWLLIRKDAKNEYRWFAVDCREFPIKEIFDSHNYLTHRNITKAKIQEYVRSMYIGNYALLDGLRDIILFPSHLINIADCGVKLFSNNTMPISRIDFKIKEYFDGQIWNDTRKVKENKE